MICVEAIVKGDKHIPISVVAGADRGSPKTKIDHAGSVRDVAARELNLSGYQLVFGCACFLGAAKLLLWAFLKLWLFEP